MPGCFKYALPLLALLTGCVPMLVTGGAETAVVASQERPAGKAMDDAGIYLKIKGLYAGQDSSDLLANVSVKVVEGRVLLAGNVDEANSQIEAVRLAWQANGVKEVMNEIQVNDKSTFWNYTQDVWISAQVRTRFLIEKEFRSVNYSIITVNQVVYIMGIAQNQTELERSTAIASTTSYVKKVVSYVVLKDDPRRTEAPAPLPLK